MERQHNLPTAEQVDGMKEDAAVKGTELEHAQHTQAHLQTVRSRVMLPCSP